MNSLLKTMMPCTLAGMAVMAQAQQQRNPNIVLIVAAKNTRVLRQMMMRFEQLKRETNKINNY